MHTKILEFFEKNKPLDTENLASDIKLTLESATKLAGNMARIKKYLDGGYLLSEMESELGRKVLYQKWDSESELFELRTNFEEIITRIEYLQQIENQDVREINSTLHGDRPEVVVSVWKQLQDAQNGFGTISDLNHYLTWHNKVRQLASRNFFSSSYPERAQSLRTKLIEQGPKIWIRSVKNLQVKKDLYEALKLRSSFNVNDTELPAWLQFNILVIEASQNDLTKAESS